MTRSTKKIPITEATHARAKLLSGCGLRDSEIATALGMSEATLKRRCAKALADGRAIAVAAVAQTLYRMATSGKSVAATIFYLKCKGGFNERMEISGPEGSAIEVSDVHHKLVTKLAALAADREARAVPPATEPA